MTNSDRAATDRPEGLPITAMSAGQLRLKRLAMIRGYSKHIEAIWQWPGRDGLLKLSDGLAIDVIRWGAVDGIASRAWLMR